MYGQFLSYLFKQAGANRRLVFHLSGLSLTILRINTAILFSDFLPRKQSLAPLTGNSSTLKDEELILNLFWVVISIVFLI